MRGSISFAPPPRTVVRHCCQLPGHNGSDLIDVGDDEKVPFALVEGGLAIGDRAGLVVAHRKRHVLVRRALPEMDRHRDVFEAEAPRPRVQTQLVDAAARALAVRLASVSACRPNQNRILFCLLMPSVAPGASNGPPPLMMYAPVSRCGIAYAQAATYGPPPETPATPKRSMPSAAASSVTSSGQSRNVRPGLKSERPCPGRSLLIRRPPCFTAASCPMAASRRDPGKPWKKKTGLPAGSPYSA